MSSTIWPLRLILGLSLILASLEMEQSGAKEEPPPAKQNQRLDSAGDPLPDGAIARLGSVRFFHCGPIDGVALSPNGKLAASSGRCDGLQRLGKYEWPRRDSKSAIYIWDIETGKRILEVKLPDECGSVFSLAFSPDNQMLAGSCGNDVVVWSVATGKELYRVKDHEHYVVLIRFSEDGKTLISGASFTGVIRYTDAQTGKPLRSVTVWNRDDPTLVPRRTGRYEIEPRSLSTMTNKICIYICASGEKTIEHQKVVVLDATTGKQIIEMNKAGGSHDGQLALSRDGKLLATDAKDGRHGIYIWNADNGAFLREIKHDGRRMSARRLSFSPNGKFLVSSHDDGWLGVWDVDTGKLLRRHYLSPTKFVVSDTTLLVGTNSGCLHVFDIDTGKEKLMFTGHRDGIYQMQFSADNTTLLTRCGQRDCCWDTSSWKERIQLPHKQPIDLESELVSQQILSPDGKKFIRIFDVETRERDVSLYDAVTGKKIRRFGDKDWRHLSAQFTADSGKVLIRHDTDTRPFVNPGEKRESRTRSIFDTSNGTNLSHVRLDLDEPWSFEVKLSPDGGRLFWVADDHRLQVVDIKTKKVFSTFTGQIYHRYSTGLTYPQASSNGLYLAAFCDDAPAKGERPAVTKIHIYEIGTWLELGQIEITPEPDPLASPNPLPFGPSTDLPAEIHSMAVSPDGRTLAINRRDETFIRIFDVLTGKERKRLEGHLDGILSLEFSPDGRILASGGRDTTVLIWDTKEFTKPSPPAAKLTDGKLLELWKNLDSQDLTKAGEAIQTLAQTPEQSVPFLKEKLKPIPRGKEELVARLIEQLDSDDFQKREAASRQLASFAESIETTLRQALKADLTAEQKRRLELLLLPIKATAPPLDQHRGLRAVKVLEYTATNEARAVLKTLAEGAPDARLTNAAKEALERMK